MLEGVLAPGGTASEVSVPGYTLPGKTGTAQKAINGKYSDTHFVASFVGFAPAMDPKILVAVVVDDPRASYYGGTVAAPAFGEIAKFALPYLGVPPDQPGTATAALFFFFFWRLLTRAARRHQRPVPRLVADEAHRALQRPRCRAGR